MRIVTTKNERTLGDLVTRVFEWKGAPAPAVRQAAEAALLAANPHLRDLASVPEGAPVVVPEVPGATHAAADRTALGSPAALVGEMRRALTHLATSLGAAAAREADTARETLALVKSREVKALGKKVPLLDERLPGLAEAATERLREADALAEFHKDTLPQAARDLAELAKRLT